MTRAKTPLEILLATLKGVQQAVEGRRLLPGTQEWQAALRRVMEDGGFSELLEKTRNGPPSQELVQGWISIGMAAMEYSRVLALPAWAQYLATKSLDMANELRGQLAALNALNE